MSQKIAIQTGDVKGLNSANEREKKMVLNGITVT